MSGSSLIEVVAARIRSIRSEQGISQESLAEQCGLHRTYIGSVERGERNITLRSLERIASALGVEPAALLVPRSRMKKR